jgi:protein O-GlcNAc transferase
VTLIGDRFISRVGTSLLRTVGLGDLAAATVEEYVDIARRLADDIPRLTSIRASLRQDMMASPLGDAPRFARDLEAVFRTMWRRWCADRS